MVTRSLVSLRFSPLVALLVVLVAALATASLGTGPVRLPPLTVVQALFGGGTEEQRIIVQGIRLPRAILGLAIGAILGLSGAALQGLLRNPLASPSLFGAPQSAALGAVLVIATGLADVRSFLLPVVAIVFAFGSVFALLAIAGRNAGLLLLILAGLALSSLAGALTALAMNLSPNPFATLEIAFWLLGSLEDRSFRHVMLALPFAYLHARSASHCHHQPWLLRQRRRSTGDVCLGADAPGLGGQLARAGTEGHWEAVQGPV